MQNRMESNIRDKFLVKMIKLQEFTEKKRIAEMLNEMNPKLKALLARGWECRAALTRAIQSITLIQWRRRPLTTREAGAEPRTLTQATLTSLIQTATMKEKKEKQWTLKETLALMILTPQE